MFGEVKSFIRILIFWSLSGVSKFLNSKCTVITTLQLIKVHFQTRLNMLVHIGVSYRLVTSLCDIARQV